MIKASTTLALSLLATPLVVAQRQTLTVAASGGNQSSPLLYGTLYEVIDPRARSQPFPWPFEWQCLKCSAGHLPLRRRRLVCGAHPKSCLPRFQSEWSSKHSEDNWFLAPDWKCSVECGAVESSSVTVSHIRFTNWCSFRYHWPDRLLQWWFLGVRCWRCETLCCELQYQRRLQRWGDCWFQQHSIRDAAI